LNFTRKSAGLESPAKLLDKAQEPAAAVKSIALLGFLENCLAASFPI
jgi:hypothetical protein